MTPGCTELAVMLTPSSCQYFKLLFNAKNLLPLREVPYDQLNKLVEHIIDMSTNLDYYNDLSPTLIY